MMRIDFETLRRTLRKPLVRGRAAVAPTSTVIADSSSAQAASMVDLLESVAFATLPM